MKAETTLSGKANLNPEMYSKDAKTEMSKEHSVSQEPS